MDFITYYYYYIELDSKFFGFIRFEFGEGLGDWMIEMKLCDISA